MFIVGLVGPFGSGCSYVASLISERHGYNILSLSDVLREEFIKDHPERECTRTALQDFGNKIRQDRGGAFLAEKVWGKIQADTTKSYIVDSIRNPSEVDFFRSIHTNFFLFGVFAEPETRWQRIKEKYDNDKREFEKDDERDSGEKEDYGQRVTDTFRLSDIIILNRKNMVPGNEDHIGFCHKLQEKIDIIERRLSFKPTANETYMTMAYAASMRSSCIKRKVGSIIIDDCGNVFSSGYNEVPLLQRTCQQEYNSCYRDKLKADFKQKLPRVLPDEGLIDSVYGIFKDSFKILDYCRALHAEENAILNVARIGASVALKTATLYTTTYPCNLCANKIAKVNIKSVVYFEPYPMEEAKRILLENHITQTPFEGVTHNAYFKLMEVVY